MESYTFVREDIEFSAPALGKPSRTPARCRCPGFIWNAPHLHSESCARRSDWITSGIRKGFGSSPEYQPERYLKIFRNYESISAISANIILPDGV
jgi:hypothetical protein